MWRDKSLALSLRLQLYESGVCLMATHAFEAWKLSAANMKTLQLWNARRLAFITGRSIRQEYKHPSFDLVAALRRRLRWLGHVDRCGRSCGASARRYAGTAPASARATFGPAK